MCVYFVAMMCAGRFGLGWAHDVFKFACHMFMQFPCISTFIYLYFDIDLCWYYSACLFLSPFLSVSCSMAPKRKSTPSQNPLRFRASSSSLSDSTPSHVWFRDDKFVRTFWRTFHDEAFIQNAKLFYQTFSILTFPLSFTVGVRSHYVASQSLVAPWSYRSFTPTCTDSILQYLSLSLAFEVHAL